MNLEAFHRDWLERGSPGDVNNSVPPEIKWYYLARTLKDFGLDTFIESGTSAGDTTARMLIEGATRVYTIEAWRQAFTEACQRFYADERVDLRFGDSGELLHEILRDNGGRPALFWLDAHYSGDGTAQLDKQTPIVAELKAIAEDDCDGHCIVIDDARGFGVWDDYPPMDELRDLLADLFPNHSTHLEGDEIFVLP